jgi:two-component system phosphate regulon sensor histidine kinase PhoR
VILKQKRLSEVQRDFVNNMTHEFKTPIATIDVSADLIANPKILVKPEAIVNYANIIKTQNNRLKSQIEKVLQMAAMDRGKLKLNKEVIDLHQLVQEAVKSFNLKDQAEITVNLEADDTCKCVMADKVHLTNIIYNLLDNAVKYVDGYPKIKIQTHQVKNQITLSIQDNGIGIGKEHQRKVFEKFFRVPTGNVHNVKGFGLGLNYVKQIVKAHKWKINLASEIGKGSTFTITMPIQKVNNVEEKEKKEMLSVEVS